MTQVLQVEITAQPLDVARAHALVANPAHGAVASFVGVVRSRNLGRDVVGVSYDVHAKLAINVLERLGVAVRERCGGQADIYVGHYRGRLEVGGISVVIAVSTPHRGEAFAACRALIEDLKHQAPIWKQEHYVDGDSEWVQGHALCQHGPSGHDGHDTHLHGDHGHHPVAAHQPGGPGGG